MYLIVIKVLIYESYLNMGAQIMKCRYVHIAVLRIVTSYDP